MKEHYIVTIDRGQLRIYAETKAFDRLEVVEAMDFPRFSQEGFEHSDWRNDSRELGRADRGESVIHGDLFSKRVRESQLNSDLLARELDNFLQNRPAASWDFAASPAVHDFIIEKLSLDTRRRLKRVVSEAIVNERAEDVRDRFTAADR